MYMNAAPIWEAWTSGGPFIGESRANARVTVDVDWQLLYDATAFHRGRGTWWRDDPTTLTDFALSTSWMVDSRKRRGDRSFQQVRNGEWTYWGGNTSGGSTIPPPSGVITRAAMAVYLKGQMDSAYTAAPATTQALPAYDGTVDYPDISSQSAPTQAAIGQLSQAGIIVGFPDGYYRPTATVSDAQRTAYISRAQEYLWGTSAGGSGVVELPNVETVQWDRSIDTDAAECTITMSNIQMKANLDAQADLSELGLPGMYTPYRGDNPDAVARWPNHAQNEWAGILMPNVILRTYEGYGGTDLTVRQAVAAGQLKQTGTWMVDRVTINTDGTLNIQARDMARLLIEQFLMPPIVPASVYGGGGLRYCRYVTLETGEQRSGNYFDYADLIYDFLLWAGFYFDVFPQQQLPDLGGGPPPEADAVGWAQVHGIIETTGAYADQCLPDDLFDKRPVIDAITEIRGIVGYLFWIDEEGAAHFQNPNWFIPGNYDENLIHIDFVPEIDEKVALTGYSMSLSSENLRTKIVISSEAIPAVPPFGSTAETYAAYKEAVGRATFYTPPEAAEWAHGMELPAMWINGAFNDPDEQQTMAELIGMHIYYRQRQGSVTMLGNPCIQINDQVRIYERQTSEAYMHYVRGVSSTLDNTTGIYEMRLTTHWLGDGDGDMASRPVTSNTEEPNSEETSSPLPISSPITETPTAPTPVPGGGLESANGLGVYLAGGAGGAAQITNYETWLGGDVPWVLEFFSGISWSSIISSPGWIISAWAPTGKLVCFTVPMLPDDGYSLSQGAAGNFNAYFTQVAQNFVSQGIPNAVIRLGHEFNTGFQPWSTGSSSTNASLYAEFYRQVVTTMRAVSAGFIFDWCVLLGGQLSEANLALAYPGDNYVDIIGMDVYDQTLAKPLLTPAQLWTDTVTRSVGLQWHRDFAAAHSKPVSFPEWGLTCAVGTVPPAGDPDNTNYIYNMRTWFEDSNLAYAMYFDRQAGDGWHKLSYGTSDHPQFPLSAPVYRSQFSGGLPTG